MSTMKFMAIGYGTCITIFVALCFVFDGHILLQMASLLFAGVAAIGTMFLADRFTK